MTRELILLGGIPASGKTFFGHWLEENMGFRHLDLEKHGVLSSAELTALWNATVQTDAADVFVSTLREAAGQVVIDWGFPPSRLPVVRSMKDHGVDIWWFDADLKAAREEFIERGGISLEAFDIQISRIEESWPGIERVFQPNLIRTLDEQRKRLAPKAICNRIFKTGRE